MPQTQKQKYATSKNFVSFRLKNFYHEMRRFPLWKNYFPEQAQAAAQILVEDIEEKLSMLCALLKSKEEKEL